MNKDHVIKAQPQYCSNVCMKLNAKLGGATSRVAGKDAKTSAAFFSVPTMIIGVDVSHASPGSQQASMAAITMSMDREAMRYAAAVQTNGRRVEMVSRANIENMIVPLFEQWCKIMLGAPAHIYYFRDGELALLVNYKL
jgi:eukaryotic translation initiation factor 2C